MGHSAKVGIVGAGGVGTACVGAMALRGSAREIVLVNRDAARARGTITDLQYGALLAPPVVLRAGDYGDLRGAAIVALTAGVNERSGGATDRSDPAGRLKLLQKNTGVYEDVVARVVAEAPEAILLVVTDPPDALADVARRVAGHGRVLSTGTFLDSLRFRFHLAARLGVDARSVEAMVLGEHGTSQVFAWSAARVGGAPIAAVVPGNVEAVPAKVAVPLPPKAFREEVEKAVRYANIDIIEGTGASRLGIGIVVARIAEMVLRDERQVIPIGSWHERYGVTLSLPSVVGRNGVERVIAPALSPEEEAALQRSAEALRSAASRS
ncbi:MAG TPA: hypothetical protein VFJ62_11415 [Usitatibacter sp.]|nr:hypothetical protein [Usitatibacter sp.]